jgi:tetratricopeptide (TPR) repeat protein
MSFKSVKIALLTAVVTISTALQAQNSNVVSAAIEYKKYMPAFMQGNLDEAKSVIMEAKSFIDPAMKHEDTKNDEKANMYNGKIYFALIELSTQFEDLEQYQNEETMDMIEESFKTAMESRKYKREVEEFIESKVSQAMMVGQMLFKKKSFDQAYAGFIGAYELQKMIGVDDVDMKNNAIISARNYIDTLKKQEKNEEAIEFIKQASQMFPKNSDIAIQGVNISLDMGDLEQAEKFFMAAAEADSTNKALFSTMGSIYLSNADKGFQELQGMDVTNPDYPARAEEVELMYTKAENNLKKAIEIDPEYLDASYNLGVLYLGRGQKLEQKAKQMDYNDPNYEAVMEKSEKMYKNAIAPLETYIKQDPNNAGVLQVLFQVHRRAGNTEKAIEYKKRYEAAAAE